MAAVRRLQGWLKDKGMPLFPVVHFVPDSCIYFFTPYGPVERGSREQKFTEGQFNPTAALHLAANA
jgi:hypothetical protein